MWLKYKIKYNFIITILKNIYTFLIRKAMRIQISILAKSILLLPATFAHETMHLLFALLTFSQITHFTIIPKIVTKGNGARYEFGSVGFIPKLNVLNFIVGMAPLMLWWIAAWILVKYQIVVPAENRIVFSVTPLYFHPWLTLVIFWLLWGGIPSSQDIRISIKGFFSPSGIIVIGVMITLVYLYHKAIVHGIEELLPHSNFYISDI